MCRSYCEDGVENTVAAYERVTGGQSWLCVALVGAGGNTCISESCLCFMRLSTLQWLRLDLSFDMHMFQLTWHRAKQGLPVVEFER